MQPILDVYGRPLRSLRLSVTDRCNVRCRYCMPEHDYEWISRDRLLTFEEMDRLVGILASAGVSDIRLTGGEPLLRRDLPVLISLLSARRNLQDLALTTNGTLLADAARPLAEAGLMRLTVSLDTLRADRFKALCGHDALDAVLTGIHAAVAEGFRRLKLNTVVMRGCNDDELIDLLEFARAVEAEVRFIEYMDVGGATQWNSGAVFSQGEILARIENHYGKVAVHPRQEPHAPATRFVLQDGLPFGVIPSTTQPFCGTCDRLRLTADGMLYLCLYAENGLNLRDMLSGATPDDEIAREIRAAWQRRGDRGAEQRLNTPQRGPFVPLERLRKDIHLEMHTRGG